MSLPAPKVNHTGVAGPAIGPYVYVVVGHTGKMVAVEGTRHKALQTRQQLHDCNDYRIEAVPVGAVPMLDLSIPKEFRQ